METLLTATKKMFVFVFRTKLPGIFAKMRNVILFLRIKKVKATITSEVLKKT